jgi:hypothetical protein
VSTSAATRIEFLSGPAAPGLGSAKQRRVNRPLALFLPARGLIEKPKSQSPAVFCRAALLLCRRYDSYNVADNFPVDLVSRFYTKLVG